MYRLRFRRALLTEIDGEDIVEAIMQIPEAFRNQIVVQEWALPYERVVDLVFEQVTELPRWLSDDEEDEHRFHHTRSGPDRQPTNVTSQGIMTPATELSLINSVTAINMELDNDISTNNTITNNDNTNNWEQRESVTVIPRNPEGIRETPMIVVNVARLRTDERQSGGIQLNLRNQRNSTLFNTRSRKSGPTRGKSESTSTSSSESGNPSDAESIEAAIRGSATSIPENVEVEQVENQSEGLEIPTQIMENEPK